MPQDSCNENHAAASQNLPITFPFPAQQVWIWGKWAKFGQLECTTPETGWSGQLNFSLIEDWTKKSFRRCPPRKRCFSCVRSPFSLLKGGTSHWWDIVRRKVKTMKLNLPNLWHLLKGEIFFSSYFFFHLWSKHDPFHGKISLPQLPWVDSVVVTHMPHPQWSKTLLFIR